MTRFSALATALALIATGVAPTVSAEVLIAPTRVELDRAERSTELVVVNKGNEEAAFRVSIENRRMRLDGSRRRLKRRWQMSSLQRTLFAFRRGGLSWSQVSARPFGCLPCLIQS